MFLVDFFVEKDDSFEIVFSKLKTGWVQKMFD